MVKATDFTTKGEDEDVNILIGGTQSSKIKKKHLTGVLVEKRRELNEYGVYNSETDTQTNPKTKENAPDELTGMLSKLESSIKNVIGELENIRKTVMDDSNLSYDSFDICISELNSYLKSINDESELSASANPN